ncbi:MAG: hypothetical protein P8K76_17700 [Candidatus Binatia bacterium]|nr:hypothetical protein [Candidatus Binatia bacterium]MDG1957161.1 hypothetical protein [Candidatus Binatia bacterium]MDG2011599.1 hypothetical protein [Candidatus Binatia bacterium]
MAEYAGTSVELEAERVLLRVFGEDRSSFLHGMLSNDITGLAPGEGAAALLLTEQGRIVAAVDLLVFSEEILLDLTGEARERLQPALERFIVADDVEFEMQPGVAVAIRGESVSDFVGELLGAEAVPELRRHHPLVDGLMHISRVDDLGCPGYRVWCATTADANALLDRCDALGARRLSPGAREGRRIAAGVAREGVDFDETTLAPEVPSLSHAISNRKGCYLGQEVVERVASRGKVKWLVAALRVAGACDPGIELEVEGRGVGHLTSVAPDSVDGEFAAIARVRRDVFDEGMAIDVMMPGGAVGARPDPGPERAS